MEWIEDEFDVQVPSDKCGRVVDMPHKIRVEICMLTTDQVNFKCELTLNPFTVVSELGGRALDISISTKSIFFSSNFVRWFRIFLDAFIRSYNSLGLTILRQVTGRPLPSQHAQGLSQSTALSLRCFSDTIHLH